MFFTSGDNTLALENDRLRAQLQREQTLVRVLQSKLREAQAQVAQAALDSEALSSEIASLKSVVASMLDLPEPPRTLPRLSVGSVLPYSKPASPPRHRLSSSTRPSLSSLPEDDTVTVPVVKHVAVPKTPVLRDDWCEETIVPSGSDATLHTASVNKLLLDWAQGDARKHTYLSEWLAYHVDGQRAGKSQYANPRVELKFLTPAMLDGFRRLVLPALRAARPDLDVHCYSKDYVGHSLRIVLDDKPVRSSMLAPIRER
ncbi:hypothetical protein ACHHYP_12947 [Achlya hypogyna]|uniref:Uncharacterized protein n=1 Tax=Achlya hypogyna TaxID=1202772 RepID=A0A1V9ZG71_ACHHY|nr:hypothetical protein ACHHYP_12947 [Achlya hypogyna]